MPSGGRTGAEWWRLFHAIATVVWLLLGIPTVLWWNQSILWLGLMSVYACFSTHLSSWQATRAEVKADGDTTP